MEQEILASETSEAIEVRSPIFVVLFLWLVVVLLSAISGTSDVFAGRFLATGAGVLSLAALALPFFRRRGEIAENMLFGVFVLMTVLPSNAAVLFSPHRNIVTDLLVMLLLLVPAVVGAWRWTHQAAAGVVSVLVLLLEYHFELSTGLLESFVLIAMTSVLSTGLALFRSEERGLRSVTSLLALPRNLENTCLLRLPIQVWHVFVLQGSLVATLVLIDVSKGETQLTPAMVVKIYALIIVLVGSALATLHRSSTLIRTLSVTTLALGIVLSFARAAEFPQSAGVHVLPLIALAWITAILPWSVWRHIAILWGLMISDVAVRRLALSQPDSGPPGAALGAIVHLYRAEYGLLACGFVLSLFFALSVRRLQLRHLARYLDIGSETDVAFVYTANTPPDPGDGLPAFIERERVRRLLFGLFCLGIVSSVISSQLLLDHLSHSLWPIFTWVMFLTFWGAIVLQVQARPSWTPVWGMGALLTLLLFLWPTLIVAQIQDSDTIWIFWTGGLLFGVAVVPWRIRELVPLALVICTIAAELSHRLTLAPEQFIGLVALAGGAVAISLLGAKRIHERCLFRHVSENLVSCQGENDVVRFFARTMTDLFQATLALVSAGPNEVEIIRSGAVVRTVRDDGVLRGLASNLGASQALPDAKRFRLFRWVPEAAASDASFPGRQMQHGIFVDDVATLGDAPLPVESQFSPVFFVTVLPPFEPFLRRRLAVASLCRDACALRIAALREAGNSKAVAEAADLQAVQREYQLGTLVHDINNTVQDMTLLCETILERLDDEPAAAQGEAELTEQRRETVGAIERIAAIARSVATVVSDAKRRKELEKLEDLTPRELVDVNSVIGDLVSFARLRAERKRISVGDPQLPAEAAFVKISVREHLETILRNLLNNALLYSPPGGAIDVYMRADETWVEIGVKDTGFGLTEEECTQVFLPGFRGKSASAAPGGLGLGLAESQRVARAAGGEITAESPGPSCGSVFTLRLPRHYRPTTGRASAAWALLVDDQPSFTEFYAKIARSMRMVPVSASSVDEALGFVDERGKPGLVVTDIHLGTSDGLDLVRQLRRQFGTELPILVISGLTSEDMNRQVRLAGATDFVAKPIGMRALYARVQSLLV